MEGGLDQFKRDLATVKDFSLAGAFNYFAGYSHARISASELRAGFEKQGIACDQAEIALIMDRYDADGDGKLGFWEFSNILLPIDGLMRDELERRPANFDMSLECREHIKRVLRRIVDTEAMMETLRQRISREKSVNLRNAFDAMDWLKRGFLTCSEFRKAFDWHNSLSQTITGAGYEINPVEMEGFIRRFNKDKMNGRISLPEFVDELTVKSQDKPF